VLYPAAIRSVPIFGPAAAGFAGVFPDSNCSQDCYRFAENKACIAPEFP
jgi:hypothetical protein